MDDVRWRWPLLKPSLGQKSIPSFRFSTRLPLSHYILSYHPDNDLFSPQRHKPLTRLKRLCRDHDQASRNGPGVEKPTATTRFGGFHIYDLLPAMLIVNGEFSLVICCKECRSENTSLGQCYSR